MTIDEIFSLLWTLLPYLNSGMILLTVNLVLKKTGFEISPKEFKRKPWESLFLGLTLVFVSGVLSLFVQTELSGIKPLGVFFIVLLAFLVVSQV